MISYFEDSPEGVQSRVSEIKFIHFTSNNMLDFDTGLAPVDEIIVFSLFNAFTLVYRE
jgi:hypothetical protein